MNRITFFFCFLLTSTLSAQTVPPLTGQVLDKSQPVVGATIHLLNTNTGTVTDISGKFTLTGVPAGKYVLEISALGYASQKKEIEMGSNASLTIQLEEIITVLNDVTVTAQKREEDLLEIPVSISALSSREVQQYRLWNSKDITAIVPNLYSSNPGDNRNVTSIRGITSTSYDPAVATYIDGVNQFGLDTYIAQLFDVERIEVLRGPQGTLYGRNAMGGVINIITKQPSNKTEGFAELSVGNYNQLRTGFGVRTPLVKDKLFLGVSGVYDKTDGFYTNNFNSSSFDKKYGVLGNYYLRYRVNSQWAITLNVKHNQIRNNGAFPLAGTAEDALANPFIVNQNAITTMYDNNFNTSVSANYFGRSFNFTSITTQQSNYKYYDKPIDGDFSPIDGIEIRNNYGSKWNNTKVLTQEFKINSPASSNSPLKWTGGSYLFYQNSPVKQATYFGEDSELITGQPDSQYSIINTSNGKGGGVALYGQLSYTLNDKIDFTLGMRYDYEHKKQQALAEYQHNPDPEPVFDVIPDTTATASFSAISPKASIAYRLNQYSNLYIVYSRGYRAGGLTQLSSDPSVPPLYLYKPEYSNNYEIGFKRSFLDNRLQLNLAAFYFLINNAQVPALVLPQALTVTKNTGELTGKGVEMEVAFNALKGLEISYNLGINKATYRKLNLPQNGQEVDLQGNHQLFTPSTTSMLAVQYTYAVSNTFRLFARGEWMHLGEQYYNLTNTIKQDPYSLLNTRVGIGIKKVEFSFWGRNVTDTKYITYAYDFGATHLGDPRNYGVTARLNF